MTHVHATAHPAPPGPQGGELYRLALPNTSSAAKLSRDFIASLLTVSRHCGLVDDARLCVTEVVTNAHRHTRTPLIRVRVIVQRKLVTVSVADDDHWALPEPPAFRDLRGEQEGGRGLLLVERLASAWGMTVLGGCFPYRKAVWFTLTRAGSAP
ncbi:ATP-binding protein [Streptomyces sp. NBC_00264]|uniref:ATP-binding protein n=1 Tax=unclassified Streptomyces TaxID=2593676 RepID=UPI0022593995|nr:MULTISPECIES: ATP-binding protein [unclassified Streptomyces]MCX5161780.1 ATP-binding protein [Streptomyces sp. NBC_00305]MCX5220303.1 ATP-binding protein [Streptomyces sp. NBC_00264]